MMVAMRADERGGIVTGWLIKLVLSLAIVGVVAFEAGALVVAHVGADTAANEVATEAAFAAAKGGSQSAAETAAQAEATRRGVRLIGVSVANDGKSVTVIIEKSAKTLLIHRVSFTKSWTLIRVARSHTVAP
jgi:hypothetical protein